MTDWQLGQQGLILPVEPAEPSLERNYGPLEIVTEHCRKEAYGHFQALIDMVHRFPPVKAGSLQEKAIRDLAEALLGDDVDFEILC